MSCSQGICIRRNIQNESIQGENIEYNKQIVANAIFFSFFYINLKNYNICYILLCSNYCATLQGRYHEEQKTMSTPWPTHRDIKIHIKNGTHDTILINTGICFTLVARLATKAPDAKQQKPRLREQPTTATVAAVPDSLQSHHCPRHCALS